MAIEKHDIIAKKLARHASTLKIKYALIFGSFAKGRYTKESDIDIAIKLENNIKKEDAVKILEKIINIIDEEKIDIVIINFAPFSLLYDIYTQGKLIFCKDKNEFYSDAFKILKLYEDWKNIARHFENREIQKVFIHETKHA